MLLGVPSLKLCSPEPVGRRRGCGGLPPLFRYLAAVGRSVTSTGTWIGLSWGMAVLGVLVVNGAERRGEWTPCGLILFASPAPPSMADLPGRCSCGLFHSGVTPDLR